MKMLRLFFLLGIVFIAFSCNQDTYDETPNLETEKRQDIIPGFNFMTPCEAINITYFVDPNCDGTVYQNAILDAVQEYNDAPVGLNLTEVGTAAEADIVIDCVDGDGCGEGVAFFDDNDNRNTAESNINLEIDWETCLCTDPNQDGCNLVGFEPACMFTRTVMHEIGHAIGIHHNGEGDHIEGTPDTGNDPNSVFNSGPVTNANCDWCDAPCEFNENDLQALQILFPPCECRPRVRINGPRFICDVGEQVTYCIPNQFTIVDWGVPNNMSEVSRNGNCITVSLSSFNGYDPLTVSIVDVKGCIQEYELFINTHEYPNFDIVYNGPICFGDVVQFNILPLPAHQNLNVIDWEIEYGGLNIMSSNQKFAVVEATYGTGPARICATAVNECGNEKRYCINVTIQRDSDCTGDGDIPNPK